MNTTMEQDLLQVVAATKYPLDAFAFLQRGLGFTVEQIHGEASEVDDESVSRHITGRQLCFGLRDYAIDQYGLMARAVLRHWRINGTEDFGRIVFAMVDAGLMHKTDEDCLDDFVDVFDFADAFTKRLELKTIDN